MLAKQDYIIEFILLTIVNVVFSPGLKIGSTYRSSKSANIIADSERQKLKEALATKIICYEC